MARRTKYTVKTARIICQVIENGESLRDICKSPTMPNKSTVFRWLNIYPEFKERYSLSVRLRAETYIERVLEIADNATNETLQASKLKIECLKWYLAKLAPRVH